tara:strand:+ start:6723 stop:7268 length:546 start_codon:yes stop_codon:yes gene_type:complete
MTGSCGAGGGKGLCGADDPGRCGVGREVGSETELIDRLVELVLALEPLELKQGDPVDVTAAVPEAPGDSLPAPTLLAESTQRMLAQMRAVLDREAARLGADGVEGKAAVDQVSLIARTLEKIDQMERLIAEDQARTTARTLSADEREQMRQTVRQLILAAAERLAAERRTDGLTADEMAAE